MHDTALKIGQQFFEAYAGGQSTILELGSYNVNGSLRDVAPQGAVYVGLDASAGASVDVVIEPHKDLPISSNSVDIVVSSSMFEHDLFFWETFLEMVRVAKPGGILYVSAPSNGGYHCYPVDNWRFYPDCGKALEAWAHKNGHTLTLIESFVAERAGDVWNDFVAIFKKDRLTSPDGLPFLTVPSTNAWRFGQPKVERERESSEDMVIIETSREKIATLEQTLTEKNGETEYLKEKISSAMNEIADVRGLSERRSSEDAVLINALRGQISQLFEILEEKTTEIRNLRTQSTERQR